ncbi:MAG: 30S ribosomal protein S20 [Candidatus Bipolaricaulota bacterium]
MRPIPVIKSAKKRLKQNRKRRARNKERKEKLREVTKKIDKLISAGNKEEAEDLLPELARLADRAASKGPLHENKAARIKSKFSKRVDSMD